MQKLRNSLSITAGAALNQRRSKSGPDCFKPIPESNTHQQQQHQQQLCEFQQAAPPPLPQQALLGDESCGGGWSNELIDQGDNVRDPQLDADDAAKLRKDLSATQVAAHLPVSVRASAVPRGILDVMPYYEYLQSDPAFKAEQMLWDDFHAAAMARWRQIGRDKHVAGGKCCARGCDRDAGYAVLESMNFMFLRKITSTNQISSDALWKQVCVLVGSQVCVALHCVHFGPGHASHLLQTLRACFVLTESSSSCDVYWRLLLEIGLALSSA